MEQDKSLNPNQETALTEPSDWEKLTNPDSAKAAPSISPLPERGNVHIGADGTINRNMDEEAPAPAPTEESEN